MTIDADKSSIADEPRGGPINHPSHYGGFSNGAEVIDIVERLNYNRGSAIACIARAGRKPGESAVDALKKAAFLIDREIKRIQVDGKEVPPAPVQPSTVTATPPRR